MSADITQVLNLPLNIFFLQCCKHISHLVVLCVSKLLTLFALVSITQWITVLMKPNNAHTHARTHPQLSTNNYSIYVWNVTHTLTSLLNILFVLCVCVCVNSCMYCVLLEWIQVVIENRIRYTEKISLI